MAIQFNLPGMAPDWFTFFVTQLRTALNVADQQTVKFIRRDVTKADDGITLDVGTIPANGLILKPLSGVHVHEAFNAGTANVIDIGSTADGDLYGTDLSLSALDFVPLDEAVAGYRVAAATGITATVQLSGSAATTGRASVVIAYATLPKEA